jgi:hypothetical protein
MKQGPKVHLIALCFLLAAVTLPSLMESAAVQAQ